MWYGSAAICINEQKQILMVKQGKPNETKVWALPAGQKEEGESFEECCVREVFEETGYHVAINQKLFVKNGHTYGIDVHVVYFYVKLLGGKGTIQDPDGLIYEISWKSAEEMKNLELSFPEDRDVILEYLAR